MGLRIRLGAGAILKDANRGWYRKSVQNGDVWEGRRYALEQREGCQAMRQVRWEGYGDGVGARLPQGLEEAGRLDFPHTAACEAGALQQESPIRPMAGVSINPGLFNAPSLIGCCRPGAGHRSFAALLLLFHLPHTSRPRVRPRGVCPRGHRRVSGGSGLLSGPFGTMVGHAC